MKFQQKFTSFLRSSPYPRPFISRSASEKSNTVSMLHEVASFLSGGVPEHLFRQLICHSRFGKPLCDIKSYTKVLYLHGKLSESKEKPFLTFCIQKVSADRGQHLQHASRRPIKIQIKPPFVGRWPIYRGRIKRRRLPV